jgi:hypothetical protein
MAKLLFRLRNVPEDEADAIRSLLAEQGFETYETSSGIFQMSMPAIWLVQDSDFARARALIDQWQAQRVLEARANAAALFTVSWYSLSGWESATIPAPDWMWIVHSRLELLSGTLDTL